MSEHMNLELGDELVGRGVKGLWIGEDDELLVFECIDGLVGYRVDGDCCSNSWFSDITGVADIIGRNVIAVEGIPLCEYDMDQRERSEEDQAYGTRLVTESGTADIIFRNASNGYYGGWASLAEVQTLDGLSPITKDWRA